MSASEVVLFRFSADYPQNLGCFECIPRACIGIQNIFVSSFSSKNIWPERAIATFSPKYVTQEEIVYFITQILLEKYCVYCIDLKYM